MIKIFFCIVEVGSGVGSGSISQRQRWAQNAAERKGRKVSTNKCIFFECLLYFLFLFLSKPILAKVEVLYAVYNSPLIAGRPSETSSLIFLWENRENIDFSRYGITRTTKATSYGVRCFNLPNKGRKSFYVTP